MGKEKKIGVIAIVAIVVIVGFAVYKQVLLGGVPTSYSAVYLQTGEMYVGKLSLFPKMALNDAYLVTRVNDPENPESTSVQLQSAKNFIWSPPTLFLNREQVIFYGAVGEGSQIAEALKKTNNP
jgi:hypothetical protein